MRALDQHTVYGRPLRGQAALMREESRFFLMTGGIVPF